MKHSIVKTAAVSAALFAAPFVAAQDEQSTERQKIEKIVHEYLLENPEVIEAAIIELQRRRTLAQMLPTIELYRGFLENDPDASILGNPDGDVTIVEFFDYRCGYCRRHYPEVQRLVEEDSNVRWVVRHYPVLDRPNETPLSRISARAGQAAQRQGKFKEFHDAMMARRGELTEDRIYEIATTVGLDVTRLKADMNDKLLEKHINNQFSVARDIGFTGTPGYIIGEDVVLGAEGFNRLKEAVARARSQKMASAE